MTERPTLFSTPMVQAILALLKGMTRRTKGLEKINQNPNDWQFEWADFCLEKPWRFTYKPSVNKQSLADRDFYQEALKCPYGQPGDLLWVRECFGYYSNTLFYKADDSLAAEKWKPSIHMPKAAARIWLQVEEIRVERLQDISEEDAESEGVQWIRRTSGICFMDYTISEYVFPMTAKNSFKSLWKKINGNDWNIGWDINPWVWVVKFKVLSTTGKPQMCYKTNEICQYDCKGLCRESM